MKKLYARTQSVLDKIPDAVLRQTYLLNKIKRQQGNEKFLQLTKQVMSRITDAEIYLTRSNLIIKRNLEVAREIRKSTAETSKKIQRLKDEFLDEES